MLSPSEWWSQLHSTRDLQTMSLLFTFQFAKLILPYHRKRPGLTCVPGRFRFAGGAGPLAFVPRACYNETTARGTGRGIPDDPPARGDPRRDPQKQRDAPVKRAGRPPCRASSGTRKKGGEVAMPELPEVETVRRVIGPQIQGRRIEKVTVKTPGSRRAPQRR